MAIAGLMVSIMTVTTLLGALVLPAESVTVSATEDTAEPSVLKIWSAGHAPLGMVEPVSEQVKWTITLLLYQPFALGEVVAAALIVGCDEFTVGVARNAWSWLLPAIHCCPAKLLRI